MKASRLLLLCAGASVALFACARSQDSPSQRSDQRVPLNMRAVGDSVWELSYRDADGESRIRLRPRIRVAPDSARFVATNWTLYSVPGYSTRALLGALARAHDNPIAFKLGSPVDSMQLDVVLFAVDAERYPDGAFGGAGKGTWVEAKLVLADDAGEVYLNLNPTRGEAEFAVKDVEYGPVVLREISRLRSTTSRESSNVR
jgi:hypothetical protein